MFCKSNLNGKIVPNFNDGVDCFDNISNKRNIYKNPHQELQNILLIKGFFKNNILNLMSKTICTHTIYIDHLLCKDTHATCLKT